MLATMLSRRHTLLAALLATPLASHAEGPLRELLRGRRPRQPAPAQAGDVRWTDASRQRTLPLRLRLPAGDGPVPLVLFSHGLGGSVEAGTVWAQAWAEAGIATLHLQHPGSDTELLRSEGVAALRRAANVEQLVQRALDVRFVLDELQRRRAELPLLSRLRLDAVGMAGHSYGAHTTLAVAGQNYPGGRQAPMAEPRLRAFAAFSPSPGQGTRPVATPGAFSGITRPVMCLTGSLDADPFAPEGSQRGSSGLHRREVYDGLPAGNKCELWLDAADHMSFAGQDRGRLGRLGRARDPATEQQSPRHRALITATSTDWWRAHLLGDASARQRLSEAPQGSGPQDEWRTA